MTKMLSVSSGISTGDYGTYNIIIIYKEDKSNNKYEFM